MSKIGESKIEKIKNDILSFLYEGSPRSFYTVAIANEIARDDEFIRRILEELKVKNLVVSFGKKRMKWRLTDKAFEAYKELIK